MLRGDIEVHLRTRVYGSGQSFCLVVASLLLFSPLPPTRERTADGQRYKSKYARERPHVVCCALLGSILAAMAWYKCSYIHIHYTYMSNCANFDADGCEVSEVRLRFDFSGGRFEDFCCFFLVRNGLMRARFYFCCYLYF